MSYLLNPRYLCAHIFSSSALLQSSHQAFYQPFRQHSPPSKRYPFWETIASSSTLIPSFNSSFPASPLSWREFHIFSSQSRLNYASSTWSGSVPADFLEGRRTAVEDVSLRDTPTYIKFLYTKYIVNSLRDSIELVTQSTMLGSTGSWSSAGDYSRGRVPKMNLLEQNRGEGLARLLVKTCLALVRASSFSAQVKVVAAGLSIVTRTGEKRPYVRLWG